MATRVIVGGSFACDDALARPLQLLLDTAVDGGAVRIDWLPYGCLADLSQCRDLLPRAHSSSNDHDNTVSLVVLLVRVADLAAAHPELRAMGTEHSSDVFTQDATSTCSSSPGMDSFAQDVERLAEHCGGVPVIVCLCPPPPGSDDDINEEQQLMARLANARCVEVLPSSATRMLYKWHYGPDSVSYYDAVGDKRQHSPYVVPMLNVLALVVCRHICRLFRHPSEQKKCIVLDCDNTIWSGAVAEVGAQGVQLTPRFLALQRFVVTLQQTRGMVLALCSKNILDDVEAVFRERKTEMALDLHEHIAVTKVNWSPKSQNIHAIADELGLGIDSFVFIDDNPIECDEVASALPAVTVINLPDNFPTCFLDHEWIFDAGFRHCHASSTAAETTNEDRERTRFYQQNRDRELLRQGSTSHTAFLSSLGVRIQFEELGLGAEINDAQRQSLSRVLQLHQRTNQFNTATTFSKQLTEKQLNAYTTTDCHAVLCAHVTDRFGHYGLVSSALCRMNVEESTLYVDSCLLSCRALNRGVEHAMLRKLAEIAMGNQTTAPATIVFRWEPTERNQPAQLFFSSLSDSSFVSLERQPVNDAVGKQYQCSTNSGQWVVPVEAASRVSFLKSQFVSTDEATTKQSRDRMELRASSSSKTPSSLILPFRSAGSFRDFIALNLAEGDSGRGHFPETNTLEPALDPNDEFKFRRKARHQTKLALLDHLHDDSAAVIWSANRTHNVQPASMDRNESTVASSQCRTAKCATRVSRETACVFHRCRNCCYRIQRLVYRLTANTHDTARQSAEKTLANEYSMRRDQWNSMVQDNSCGEAVVCVAHRNNRRTK